MYDFYDSTDYCVNKSFLPFFYPKGTQMLWGLFLNSGRYTAFTKYSVEP